MVGSTYKTNNPQSTSALQLYSTNLNCFQNSELWLKIAAVTSLFHRNSNCNFKCLEVEVNNDELNCDDNMTYNKSSFQPNCRDY